MHYSTVREVLAAVVRGFRGSARSRKNYVVGISGIDCSGKSTLAKRISQVLTQHGIRCVSISGDDFLLEQKLRNSNPDQAVGYYYESFDYERLFLDVLAPARRHLCFRRRIPESDLLNDSVNEVVLRVHGPCVVLVEGVFLFKRSLPEVFDYKVWIDLSFDDGLARALRRPRDILHYGSEEKIRDRYVRRLYRGQRLHLELDRPAEQCQALVRADSRGLDVPESWSLPLSSGLWPSHRLIPRMGYVWS